MPKQLKKQKKIKAWAVMCGDEVDKLLNYDFEVATELELMKFKEWRGIKCKYANKHKIIPCTITLKL